MFTGFMWLGVRSNGSILWTR